MVEPKGDWAARSGSTWIHWWSPVASAKASTASWVTSCQSLTPSSSPTLFLSSSSPLMTVAAMAASLRRRQPLGLPAAQLGRRRLVGDVLERQAAPVGLRAQLAEHPEQQALHAAQQQRLRRDRLAAHLVEERRARRAGDLHRVAHVLGVQPAHALREVPL